MAWTVRSALTSRLQRTGSLRENRQAQAHGTAVPIDGGKAPGGNQVPNNRSDRVSNGTGR